MLHYNQLHIHWSYQTISYQQTGTLHTAVEHLPYAHLHNRSQRRPDVTNNEIVGRALNFMNAQNWCITSDCKMCTVVTASWRRTGTVSWWWLHAEWHCTQPLVVWFTNVFALCTFSNASWENTCTGCIVWKLGLNRRNLGHTAHYNCNRGLHLLHHYNFKNWSTWQ